ncbi:MAG: hypothetical protein NTX17_04635 [Candidatus Eisenbacteria bacterium]|nr:hypothetical protein [Candidatus Eisenbacteria bacterium]
MPKVIHSILAALLTYTISGGHAWWANGGHAWWMSGGHAWW